MASTTDRFYTGSVSDLSTTASEHNKAKSDTTTNVHAVPIPSPYYSSVRDHDHGYTESTPITSAYDARFQKMDYHEPGALTMESGLQAMQNRADWTATIFTWWLEILACCIAFTAVFAIVGTLYPHRDLPLPVWPYGLSINTLVAIYVIILKAALVATISQGLGQLKWSWFREPRPLRDVAVFDDASRGFPGAFRLLWSFQGWRGGRQQYRSRSNYSKGIASIGAVVLILAAIIDPFGQQIVRFYQCNSIEPTTNATIPNNRFVSVGEGTHIGAGINSISLDMQAAIQVSIFDSTPAQVGFICPSGNCTFPDIYKSGAHCSRCTDVTDQLQITEASEASNFTLPSTNLTANPADGAAFVMGLASGDTTNFKIQSILGWSTSGGLGQLGCTPDNDWGCRGYGAAECAISPCVLTQSASITVGNLTETVLASGGDWGLGSTEILSTVDVSCLTPNETESLHQIGYSFDSSTLWLPFNLSQRATLAYDPALNSDDPGIINGTYTNINPDCIYQESSTSLNSIYNILGAVFIGSVPWGAEAEGSGPLVLQHIFDGGNVSFASIATTFDRLANAMTVYSREQLSAEAVPTVGQVFNSQTCVGVQWPWLIYPAALTFLTLIFFILVIAETRWSGADHGASRHDYKTSLLPLMYHGLELNTQEMLGSGLESTAALNNRARGVRVVLQEKEGYWRFVQVPLDR
ncbi:hypothetical protein BX600DRAFT_500370 [Xylariales sp. PMI_506]|nr:hypothetical protein BX600DRAFT_500370 [Xylariales sp. PMI_506]